MPAAFLRLVSAQATAIRRLAAMSLTYGCLMSSSVPPAYPSEVAGQKVITLSLAECHWLRIRAALICSAEDLARVGSEQEAHYKHTYDLVRIGIDPWIK